MTVKAVVCRKGTDVVTIDPTASLAAVKTLATRRIGALIITGADQQVDGIWSERGIVRARGTYPISLPNCELHLASRRKQLSALDVVALLKSGEQWRHSKQPLG